MKSRAPGGAVYVATSKPSKWLTLAPSIAALIATIGAGFLTYLATVSASGARTEDNLTQLRQLSYSRYITDVYAFDAADLAFDKQVRDTTALGSSVYPSSIPQSLVDAYHTQYIDVDNIYIVGSPDVRSAAAAVSNQALKMYNDWVADINEANAGNSSRIEAGPGHSGLDTLEGLIQTFVEVARKDVQST